MKKITTKSFFLLLFYFVSSTMLGQFKQELIQGGHVRCLTTENEEALRSKYPNRPTTEEFENWLAPKIAQIRADRAAGKNIQTVYNIPVVIHIIHNGDAIGTGENITDAQAISQITVMNQDFRRMAGTPGGGNSTGLAVDCEINFCLAQTDPNGVATNGIVRHNIAPYSNAVANGAGGADWETRVDVEAMKAVTLWNPNNYLNMWTIRPGGLTIASGGIQDLLGYAQFPDNSGLGGLNPVGGTANTDGVVAAYHAFGTIAQNDGTFMLNGTYNLGRTMTHEVGHWLGLRHIWGDNNSCTVNATDSNKDYCPDTPAATAANFNCNLAANSCPGAPGNDQVQNYMDYTPDACMDTFTNDQKMRMITVMTNCVRRNSLNISTACQTPSPIIQFNNTSGSINEGTNCNYTDVTFPISIGKVASANATVTFNINAASTATNGLDYQIVNPSVTFAAGTTTAQNLTVRVFNDGLSEPTETLVINLTLNANGGDATLNAGASTITISLVDNDVAPIGLQTNTIFTEDFEDATGWLVIDGDLDTGNWGTVNGLDAWGAAPNAIAGICGYSEKDLNIVPGGLSGTAANPNNYFISPQIVIPAGVTSATLNYIIGSYTTNANAATGYKEHYSVYFSPTASNTAQILAGTVLENNREIPARSTELRSHNMTAFAGQTGYLVFRHHNSVGNGLLLVDTVNLNTTSGSQVQTAVNTATAYQATINTTGTAYAKDATTSKTMVDITSNTNFNYGCTTVSVSRDQATAGAAAVNYGANTANNLKVLAKTVTISPTTNNASGSATLKFYFSDAEITAWETATGNSRSALRVIKQGNSSFSATTLGTFGTSNTTLSANITNGIGGVYYFGTEATLGTSDFESQSFGVYPNPNEGNFNIQLTSNSENQIKVNVHDLRGRLVFEKEYKNNGTFNENVQLNNVQAGIYMVTVQDGEKREVKKIIIE